MKAIPVVRTKLRIPPGRPEQVSRPHLLRRLDEALPGKLILLSGPAGFGKTTLVAEWIRRRGMRAAWLSLDEGDNDLNRFLSGLVYALHTVLPDWVEPITALLQPSPSPSYEPILSALINALDEGSSLSGEEPILLVFDDFHLVESQAVHDAVGYLLERLPGSLHLVIASRADPPLPLARLRGRAQLAELRAADLRFSVPEASDFLNRVMGLQLPAETVRALSERADGWIAGLQMAAIALQSQIAVQGRTDLDAFVRSFTGSNRYILDYLLEEVLQHQPQIIQDFLLKTSILESFNAPLCDFLTQDSAPALEQASHPFPDSAAILEHLDRCNLFILPLDDRREWFRYHRLFADLLRKRLSQFLPHQASGLHRRASEWLENGGFLEDAIDHAFAAQDAERAADLVAQAAEGIMMRSEFTTLRRWLDRLPGEQIAIRPSLYIFDAWTLFFGNHPVEEIEKRLALLQGAGPEQAIKAAALQAYMAAVSGLMPSAIALARRALAGLPEDQYFLRSMAAIVLATAELSDGSPEVGHRALEEAGRVGEQTGNILAAVLVLAGKAENYRKLGQLHQAEALYRQALSLSVDAKGRKLPIAGRALIGLGDLMREWNRLDNAEEYLLEGIALIENFGSLAAYAGYVSLARLKQAQGKIPEALEIVQEITHFATQTEATPVDDWVAAMIQASFSIAQGDLAAAETWVERRGLQEPVVQSGLDEAEHYAYTHLRKYEQIIFARLRLAQHRAAEVLCILDELLPQVEALQRIGLVIEIHILRALALRQQGFADRALEALGLALHLAEPEGFTQLFLSEGEPLRSLLAGAYRRGIHREYSTYLLDAFTPEPRPELKPEAAAGIAAIDFASISEREMEVLHLLKSRLTVPEIAEKLCVAESTVRTHVKNIYSKLDVHRRMDAVQRAEGMGLFEARR